MRITRRDVVSLASQIFDTQGFVSPYVMQYKKLLPMLWHLERIAIYGDASQTGIGVVAYLIKNDNGVRRSHIFYSKSTLMPKNLRSKAAVEDALTIARFPILHGAATVETGTQQSTSRCTSFYTFR